MSSHRSFRANPDDFMFPGFDTDRLFQTMDERARRMLLQPEPYARGARTDRRVHINLIVIARTALVHKAMVNAPEFCSQVAEDCGIDSDPRQKANAVEQILRAYVHARSCVVPSGEPAPGSAKTALTIAFDKLVILKRKYMECVGLEEGKIRAIRETWKEILTSVHMDHMRSDVGNSEMLQKYKRANRGKCLTQFETLLGRGFSKISVAPQIPMMPVPKFLRDPDYDAQEPDTTPIPAGHNDSGADRHRPKRVRGEDGRFIKQEPQSLMEEIDAMVPNRTAYEIDADLTAERRLREVDQAKIAELQRELATEQRLREDTAHELIAYRRGVDYLIEENRELMDAPELLRARIQELENERAQNQTVLHDLTIENRHQAEMIAAVQRSEYAAFVALNMVLDVNGRLSRRFNERHYVQE